MGQVGRMLELPVLEADAVVTLWVLEEMGELLLSVVTVGGKSESVLFHEDSCEDALSRKSSMLERSRALEDLVASLPSPPLQSKVKRDLLLMCLPFSSTWRRLRYCSPKRQTITRKSTFTSRP